jgi:hypothetical protein
VSQTAHRLLWTAIGVVLVAVGGAGIAASFGHLPGTHADSPLLWSGLLDLWRDIRPWSLVVTIAFGLLVALLGVGLLGRQMRPPHAAAMDEVTLRDSAASTDAERAALTPDLPGSTRVRGVVLARGLERDLARDPGVRSASVVLTGTPPRPEVWIDLHVTSRARIAAVRDSVAEAVERFRRTSGLRPSHLDVTARIDPAGSRRVH